MAKTPPPASKLVAKPARKLKASKYQSFKLQKKVAPTMPPLPSAWRLFVETLKVIKREWKLFLGIMVIFGLLTMILVRGFTLGTDLTAVKQTLTQTTETANPSQVLTGTALFAYLVGSSGNTSSEAAGVFQVFLGVIVSLALIWAFRQVYANNKIRVRDAFYRGMYPLVPFIIIFFVMLLQLVPLLAGGFMYAIIGASPSITDVELMLWGLVFFLLALLSLYMLTSSVIALYIVGLPDMPPLTALRSARELVRYRRWTILRKIVFLPFILMICAAIIVVPLIILLPAVAMWAFFAVSMAMLPILHGYMYRLYRELL
jgi:hypothetical protein